MNKFHSVILSVGLLLSFSRVAAQTISIEIVPAAQTTPIGTTVDVSLIISGLGNFVPPSLGAFDLDVTFDLAILAFREAVFGHELDPSGLGSITEVMPGVMNVNLFELSLENPADLGGVKI